jgi:hypothetical protein
MYTHLSRHGHFGTYEGRTLQSSSSSSPTRPESDHPALPAGITSWKKRGLSWTSTSTVVASTCPSERPGGEVPIATNGGLQTALSRLYTQGTQLVLVTSVDHPDIREARGELGGRS